MSRSLQQDHLRELQLRDLANQLRRTPMTARQIAAKLDMTNASAYALVKALIDRGYLVTVAEWAKVGKSGPRAMSYMVQEKKVARARK